MVIRGLEELNPGPNAESKDLTALLTEKFAIFDQSKTMFHNKTLVDASCVGRTHQRPGRKFMIFGRNKKEYCIGVWDRGGVDD